MILTYKKQVLKEIIENSDEKLMGLMIALANDIYSGYVDHLIR